MTTPNKALEESIAKWESIASGENKEFPSSDNCGLCNAYQTDNEKCFDCPVYKRTGKHLCLGTPYSLAIDKRCEFGIHSKEYLDAAKLEVEFLKSLL
jgi:hypothetical protein